ncbi:MAG TPA: hypothetical protein PKD27_01280, partial [Tepidiformaceae bacterium]|nr:hypothetical protein [Tepidiformaceae bacterium]
GRALLGKLKQLPADAPNVVLIAGGVSASDAELAAEIRDLKRRADGGDSEYFATRGLTLDEFRRSIGVWRSSLPGAVPAWASILG